MPKEIVLTDGSVALVDDADYDFIAQWKWRKKKGYAVRTTDKHSMHRLLLGYSNEREIDHRDRNKLNNTRANLRSATTSQNQCNRGAQSNNTSGHKGVDWYSRHGKWRVRIMAQGKHVHLGYFLAIQDAARAYADAATRHHGDFARI